MVDWSERRDKKAFLALEDGSVFRGFSVGAGADAVGEVVFNTGMTGYQEILSDPSYAGQLVVMTFPEIGNTGINRSDMESAEFFANGFVMREINCANNWRSEDELVTALRRNNKPALAGIDTRRLASLIRNSGSMKGCISAAGAMSEREAVEMALCWHGLDGQDYARRVSCREPYAWDDPCASVSWGIAESLPPADMKVVAYDFGIKRNLLRSLRLHGMNVTVVPAMTPPEKVLAMKPDGVFLSNGPADPAALSYAIDSARVLLGKLPIMGVCLGHQILALAMGAATSRLKFGHHGCNHPVKNLLTGNVKITSQNHNYTVDPATIGSAGFEVSCVNLNDGSIEGLTHVSEMVYSVQYHPEACPGPHDARGDFGAFRKLMGTA